MVPWEAGGWWRLSPFGHTRNVWGCQEARKGPQAGRAPLMPWVWGVLAKPRGGVEVGSSNPAPARPGLLVQLCIPSLVAASKPWGCGMTLDSSLPSTPQSCQEQAWWHGTKVQDSHVHPAAAFLGPVTLG